MISRSLIEIYYRRTEPMGLQVAAIPEILPQVLEEADRFGLITYYMDEDGFDFGLTVHRTYDIDEVAKFLRSQAAYYLSTIDNYKE